MIDNKIINFLNINIKNNKNKFLLKNNNINSNTKKNLNKMKMLNILNFKKSSNNSIKIDFKLYENQYVVKKFKLNKWK